MTTAKISKSQYHIPVGVWVIMGMGIFILSTFFSFIIVLAHSGGEITTWGDVFILFLAPAFITTSILSGALQSNRKTEAKAKAELESSLAIKQVENERNRIWIEKNKIEAYHEKCLALNKKEEELNEKENQYKKLEDELKNTKKELENIYKTKTWQLGVQQEERQKMTANLKKFILERDDYTCQHCGASLHDNFNLKLEVDHIVPIAQGGKTDPSNLQTLCQACNRSKGSKSMSEFQKKKKTA